MPVSVAPYKRTYKHAKSRGKEVRVTCAFCGKKFPRYKAIVITRSFAIRDPVLRKQIDKRYIHTFKRKLYVCPSCARFRHLVQPGKSVRKKHLRR